MSSVKDMIVELSNCDSPLHKLAFAGVVFTIKPYIVHGTLRLSVIGRVPEDASTATKIFNIFTSTHDVAKHIATVANNMGIPNVVTTTKDVTKAMSGVSNVAKNKYCIN